MAIQQGISGNVRLPPLPTIKEILQLYNLKAKRQLSQNFLLNEHLNNRIVNCGGKLKGVEVCEVGPGPGNLTRSIILKGSSKIVLIEKDNRFMPCLQMLQQAAPCQIEIIAGDVMFQNMDKLFSEDKRKTWNDHYPKIQIMGNLPFQLSTALTIKCMRAISEKNSAWSYGRVRMTFTFQKEVAERIVATVMSAQRCRLSVMCQNWCEVQNRFVIPGRAFTPKPDVDAAVVHFKPRSVPIINLPFELVEKVVTAIFMYRQKYVVRGLETLFPNNMNGKLTDEMVSRAEIDPKSRSFQLSLHEIGSICQEYKKIVDTTPALYRYKYSTTKIADWVSREKESEEKTQQWLAEKFVDEYY